MNDSQQLREAIWDLVYGLLSDDESGSLIARIKSDPQAARMYAEVRLQADLVGQAARIEDSSLVFKGDGAAASAVAKATESAASASPARRVTSRIASPRATAWLAGIAATALVALLAVGTWWPRQSEQLLARNFLAADVVAQ